MGSVRERLLNPVLVREARVRMRGWRAPALIALYVSVMGLLLLGLMATMDAESRGFAPEMGAILFGFLAVVQMVLLLVAAPGLTGGALTGERERQTLDLLLVTRLSPFEVVAGKLMAALGFAGLLLVATLPLYGVLFLFGGVSLWALGRTLLIYLVTLYLVGAIGILWSTLMKRSVAAIVAAYGTVLFLVAGTAFLIIVTGLIYNRLQDVPHWIALPIWLNPIIALAVGSGGMLSELRQPFDQIFWTGFGQSIWWVYCLWAVGLGSVGLWLAARRVAKMTQE
jgi:ABC-2 type transport system permease protein